MRFPTLAATLGAAAVLATTIPAAPAAADTGDCTLAPTGGTATKTLNGRTYLVRVPSGITAERAPLLVVLHGALSNGDTVEFFSGWSGYADRKKFIVAYPQARPTGWAGVWDPYTNGSDDVEFVEDVVADISSTWCVNPDRVHADGWSNGAVMSQRMACESPDTFASVSSYGGGPATLLGIADGCHPSRPISVAMFAGQLDFTYFGLGLNTAEWRDIDDCTSTTKARDLYGVTETSSCAPGTKVVSRVVYLTSHNWPIGGQAEDQRNRLWAFFTANPRP